MEICLKRIVTIMVTYNPDIKTLSASLDAILPQILKIIIIDNASEIDLEKWLSLNYKESPISLYKNKSNLGIGTALNQGMQIARNINATHVVTLDQDSLPNQNMIFRLIEAYDLLSNKGEKVAVVGPVYFDLELNKKRPFITIKKDKIQRLYAPENLHAFEKIGGFDETLFIDHVDHEWCLRARSIGYKTFCAWKSLMFHHLGDVPIEVFWGFKKFTHHNPLRVYYFFRNAILLFKRGYIPSQWKIYIAIDLLKKIIVYFFLSPNKISYIPMILKGLWHGFRGVSGKYDYPTA